MTDAFANAAANLDQAEHEFYAAEAMAEIAALPGLRYAPLDPQGTRYGVVKDGQRLGSLVPAQPRQQLTGWTAYTTDDQPVPGTHHTARAAAAALATYAEKGPEHGDSGPS